MTRRSNRRDFLKQSSLAGVGFWVAGGLTPAESRMANEQVNIAAIGVGGKGSSDCDQAGNHGNIVALCDIDDNTLEAKAKKFPKAKKYNDFRKMLEEMDKQIDAVTVSTPDHTHAVASIMAMKMGKHVYTQKPLTHTVYEARLMREIAAKNKLATQMGNQGSASNGLRTGVEIIQSGAIGPVREIHVWTNRPIWPQAPTVMSRPPEAPVPKHVHWDLFLGPAPERPYAVYSEGGGRRSGAYHPFNWRGWWDFGTGALGDMACHTANLAFRAAKLKYPVRVAAQCGDLNPETCPSWASVVLDFPARGDLPPVKFFWYEGKRDGKKNLPPMEKFMGGLTDLAKAPGSGSLIIGEKGTAYSPNDYGADFRLLPAADFEGYKKPEPTLPRHEKGDNDDNMKLEWVRAIKGGPAPSSNFEYAGVLTEAILLGNVAMRCGKAFDWDGEHCRPVNCPEAEQYVKMEYRKGWTL